MEGEAFDRGPDVHRLIALWRRSRHILQREGLASLLRRAPGFLTYCLFEHRVYYLYEHSTDSVLEVNEADVLPAIRNFTLHVVSSNEAADRLEAAGLEFRSYVGNATEALDRGAVALCTFVDEDLAHIGWVVMTEEACDAFAEPPCKVNFADREAMRAGVWTNPKYRGLGLHRWNTFKRLQFMRDRGIAISRGAIAKQNLVAQKAHRLYDPAPYGEGRYLRVLWWKSWKEKPLSQG